MEISDFFHPWIIIPLMVIGGGLFYILIRGKGRQKFWSLIRIAVGVVGGIAVGTWGLLVILFGCVLLVNCSHSPDDVAWITFIIYWPVAAVVGAILVFLLMRFIQRRFRRDNPV